IFADVRFNAAGQFSLPTQFATDGSADGDHVLHFRATDAAGNVSPVLDFGFTLDTFAPPFLATSPAPGAEMAAGALLAGTATGTGSELTQLSYTVDGGTVFPIPFGDGGEFAVPLNLALVSAGQHTLVVLARDAAGNMATASRSFTLTAA